jgi:hypothetical protein
MKARMSKTASLPALAAASHTSLDDVIRKLSLKLDRRRSRKHEVFVDGVSVTNEFLEYLIEDTQTDEYLHQCPSD